MIIVTLTQKDLDERPIGSSILKQNPFIHASTIDLFHLVIPKLKDRNDLVLVYIDESKLSSIVKYEDKNNNQLFFPHIYGPIDENAIISIHPLIIQEGIWMNP